MTNKTVTAIYWVVAFVLAVLAGTFGANWGVDQAPTFRDEDKGAPATSASHLLYGLIGGGIGFGVVLALAAGAWMVWWMRHRRATYVDDYDDYDHDVDLLDEESAHESEHESEQAR